MCTKNLYDMIYSSWYIKGDRLKLVILGHFLPFYPTSNLQNKIFKKWKKRPGDVISCMCTINDNHMMYGSWDIECDGQNFLSFWTISCPFTPLTTQKIKILKKFQKIPEDIIILHKCTKNHDHMLHCSWYMTRDGCNFYFSFWAFFSPFTPLTTQKIKILKKWKKIPGYIIILHICSKNYDHMMCSSWDMVHNRWTDRQTDRQTDKDNV